MTKCFRHYLSTHKLFKIKKIQITTTNVTSQLQALAKHKPPFTTAKHRTTPYTPTEVKRINDDDDDVDDDDGDGNDDNDHDHDDDNDERS